VKISIIAHPNSKNPRVEKDLLKTIHVYVSAPPIEGKANREITDALAEYFKVKRSSVILMSGAKSQNKVFEIFD